ncbi:MAG: hypothetical protein KAI94_02610 [Anaerolineales bacterium]|nr:hypothetical protein [Anaerolineales bacterium]
MGLLILGLIFGFGGVVGFFYIPVLGVLFAAIFAGMLTKSPLKGLIAGAGGAAIVGAVLRYVGSSTLHLGGSGSWSDISSDLITRLAGVAAGPLNDSGIVNKVGNDPYWFFIIALAIVGAIGGLIGGIAKRD